MVRGGSVMGGGLGGVLRGREGGVGGRGFGGPAKLWGFGCHVDLLGDVGHVTRPGVDLHLASHWGVKVCVVCVGCT